MLTDTAESSYEDRAVFRPSGGSIGVFSLQGDEKQAGILGSFHVAMGTSIHNTTPVRYNLASIQCKTATSTAVYVL
jgi:hypothetical protein